MRSWTPLALVIGLVTLVLVLRAGVRRVVTRWVVRHLSTDPRRARTQMMAWYAGMTLAALAALGGGALGVRAGGAWAEVRYVVVPLVVLVYVPIATLGSPRLTRWQKDAGRRLQDAGAAPQAARAAAGVAQVCSGGGVLVAVLAFALIADHAS